MNSHSRYILLLLILMFSLNQCNKCIVRYVIEEEGGKPPEEHLENIIDLAGLDLETAKGLFAKLPEKNVLYFINEVDGKTYKFTEENGKLVCKLSGELGFAFDSKHACAFFWGTIEQPCLAFTYYKQINNRYQISENYILNDSTWMSIGQNSLPADVENIRLCGCSALLNQTLYAVTLYEIKKNGLPNSGCLYKVYNQNTSNQSLFTNPTFTGAWHVEANKILIDKNNHSFDLYQIERDLSGLLSLTLLTTDFATSTTPMHGEFFPTPVPMFYCPNETQSVYKISKGGGAFTPMEMPKEVKGKHLVIPFEEAL